MNVNGTEVPCPPGSTVAGLLEERGINPESAALAVEVNGQILPRERFDSPLNPGDAVEIVHFVGGG